MVRAKAHNVETQEVEITATMTDEWDAAVTSFNSFDEAMAFFNANEGVVSIGDVAGDGYVLTRDKEILLNVPFLIVDWRTVTDPQTLRDYATIRVMTADGRKYRINDGSTGIYKQLLDIRERHGLKAGIAVPKGLFKSEYFIDHETREIIRDLDNFHGQKDKAATYYLNQSS